MTNFKELLGTLRTNGVEFVLVGGMAAIVHGSSRLTEDLDIVYRRTPENMDRLARALSPHQPYLRGAPPGLPFQWDAATIQRGLNFTLDTSLGQIDILGDITGGGSYDALAPHCLSLEVYGMPCLVINLERLIYVKRAAGRRKDMDAIAELELLRDQANEPHEQ
ncbi:MAG TPA: nucleotidyl transferase AbiEii/AbiGii toxin family protein [Tepidisphaeraceae bacterium]|nr:nucleotidyl transferase AbiEii/AbiGii toxin family protein [Tepidisphaeraceae bacterium]